MEAGKRLPQRPRPDGRIEDSLQAVQYHLSAPAKKKAQNKDQRVLDIRAAPSNVSRRQAEAVRPLQQMAAGGRISEKPAVEGRLEFILQDLSERVARGYWPGRSSPGSSWRKGKTVQLLQEVEERKCFRQRPTIKRRVAAGVQSVQE